MQLKSVVSTVVAGFLLAGAAAAAESHSAITVWLTKADRSALLAKQATPLTFTSGSDGGPAIEVNDRGRFQTMDGFGFALTGGSAQLLMRMDAAQRTALLKQLFTTGGDGIGVSYLRVSIGASDMNERVFSYDDLSPGETDVDMAKFSL